MVEHRGRLAEAVFLVKASSAGARAEEATVAVSLVVAAAIARDSARAQKAARHHAVPPLSEAGHGLAAGGRDARPQDPVRVAASAYMIAAARAAELRHRCGLR